MYSVQEVKQRIEEARAERKAVVFKNFHMDVPSWKEFIDFAQKESDTPPPTIPLLPLEERVINGIILRNLFYLAVRSPREDVFPQILPIKEIFEKALGGSIDPLTGFINFIGGEQPIGVHYDQRETIYWQCQGPSVWEISDDAEWPELPKVQETHHLNLGDVIYMPRKLRHNVITPVSRCGIAFAYHADRSELHDANDELVKKHLENM